MMCAIGKCYRPILSRDVLYDIYKECFIISVISVVFQ